jgi:hypothetical protein
MAWHNLAMASLVTSGGPSSNEGPAMVGVNDQCFLGSSVRPCLDERPSSRSTRSLSRPPRYDACDGGVCGGDNDVGGGGSGGLVVVVVSG